MTQSTWEEVDLPEDVINSVELKPIDQMTVGSSMI